MPRTNPKTSIEAYHSLELSEVQKVYQKIIQALLVLKTGNTEAIAAQAKEEHPRVHKRISELARQGVVYKPGTTVKTKSGRQSYLWALTNPSVHVSTAKTEKALEGKNISDYSKEIQKISQKPVFVQGSLL